MDHADQLAGGGEDGLLVALPRPEGAEVSAELAVLGSGGGVRALDEDPPERRIALPGASAPPPAAALVVARTEPGVNAKVKFPRSAKVKFPSFWCFGGEPAQSSVRVSFLGRPRFFGGGGGVIGAFVRTCSGMRSACFLSR